MTLKITARQRDVFAMLGAGLPLREVARRLKISGSTLDAHRLELLRKFDLQSTAELRILAFTSFPFQEPTVEAPPAILRHESRLLPNLSLNPRRPYGAACRKLFDARSLREAAEYVRDCSAEPGPLADNLDGLLSHHTGTIGAKQAFLAALALECGRKDVQLIVAFCELQLSEDRRAAGDSSRRQIATLPMAVCWLRYKGRRIQIVESAQASSCTVKPVTELVVSPERLAVERIRLYQTFAADWCRALEVSSVDFAHLRARQLIAAANSGVFEDLLGYGLPPDFAPVC